MEPKSLRLHGQNEWVEGEAGLGRCPRILCGRVPREVSRAFRLQPPRALADEMTGAAARPSLSSLLRLGREPHRGGLSSLTGGATQSATLTATLR